MKRSELFRVQLDNGDIYRAEDGRTRFSFLDAASIMNRINAWRVIK